MQRGFTILETLVALGLISMVIAGVFSAVSVGINASTESKDEVRAFYLAQEAIEVLRNKRDANKLISLNTNPSIGWLNGIAEAGDPCAPGNTCRVDATTATPLVDCGGGWNSCGYLRQDPTNYLYGYNGSWVQTKYIREVQVVSNGADEIEVTISVKWARGSNSQELKVKTLMLNWR